jgi:hypothetical protein
MYQLICIILLSNIKFQVVIALQLVLTVNFVNYNCCCYPLIQRKTQVYLHS